MPAWSGFWNYIYSDGRTPIPSRGNVRREFAQMFERSTGVTPYGRVIRQLVNGNVGGTATGSYPRITAPAPLPAGSGVDLGGKRTIEQRTTINRATTAADIQQISDDLDWNKFTPVWPRDKSGNGGGGKRGY
jgi:hypothetical protein